MIFTDDGKPPIQAPLVGQGLVTVCAVLVVYIGTIGAGTLKKFSDDRSRDLYAVVQTSSDSSRLADSGDATHPSEPANAGSLRAAAGQ